MGETAATEYVVRLWVYLKWTVTPPLEGVLNDPLVPGVHAPQLGVQACHCTVKSDPGEEDCTV